MLLLQHVNRSSKALCNNYSILELVLYPRYQVRTLTTIRKRKNVKKAPLPTTTRDRIQNFAKKNLLVKDSLTNRAMGLLDLGATRASWFQQQLYKYWNPDYNKTGVPATTFREAAGSSLRPAKVELIMDARWWFWNILFALLPATVIAVYCEFRGQYLMFDYYEQIEFAQMRRILGEDFVQAHEEELRLPPPQNFFERVQSSAIEIVSLAIDILAPSKVDEGAEQKGQETAHEQQQAVESIHVPEIKPARESSEHSSRTEALDDINNATIQLLLKRIQQLEEKVHLSPDEPTIKNQIDRMNQSGVQNRTEDELLEKWKARMALNRERKQKEAARAQEISSLWNTTADEMSKMWETIKQSLGMKEEEERKDNDPKRQHEAASETKLVHAEPDTSNVGNKAVVDPEGMERHQDIDTVDETMESKNMEKRGKPFWRFW